jgi:archaellum component FlaC
MGSKLFKIDKLNYYPLIYLYKLFVLVINLKTIWFFMREIVRSVQENNTQYAAIEWNELDIYNQQLFYFESDDHIAEALAFHENIEVLYKKWLVGEDVQFTIDKKQYSWNVAENLVPTIALQKDKNEYLAKKVQKKIQQQLNQKQTATFSKTIQELAAKINTSISNEELQGISASAKEIDEQIKKAVAATKNISLEQGVVEHGISTEEYVQLKNELAALFDKLKLVKDDVAFNNYNILGARVEALYAQSKSSENYNDTRKEIIELQKELFTANLLRWQKDELIARIRSAFDTINARQDEWRSHQNEVKTEQASALQAKYEEIIPKALELNFSEGFAVLKNLQEITNITNLSKESRDAFYLKLNEAFTTIKTKADEENDANYNLALKTVEVAIVSSNTSELFKDARAILTSAQNELKEIRLNRKHKDELFGKLRTAFDELNKKQDEYFTQRKKENNEHLQNLLQTLKRALARKEEGMERLYAARQNIQDKTGMFKNTKPGTNELLNQFLERLTDINKKIEGAEKELQQLKKKIEKIEKEVAEN